MSRAFLKEDDKSGVVPLPARPISPPRNLVTRRGLRLIEDCIAQYQSDPAGASAAADREAIRRAGRTGRRRSGLRRRGSDAPDFLEWHEAAAEEPWVVEENEVRAARHP